MYTVRNIVILAMYSSPFSLTAGKKKKTLKMKVEIKFSFIPAIIY